MGERIMKTILAPVMIVAGLAGFLWEFPIVDNEYYTIMDTHYGNRFVLNKLFPGESGGTMALFYGESADEALRDVLYMKGAAPGAMAVCVDTGQRTVPGIEWTHKVLLPEGYTNTGATWRADGFSYGVQGAAKGRLTIISSGEYYQSKRNFEQNHRNRDNWYRVGPYMVIRSERNVTVTGVSNGFCFECSLTFAEENPIADEQIRDIGIRLAAPRSWEATLLVLINVLRGACLATAVLGFTLLTAAVRKRENDGGCYESAAADADEPNKKSGKTAKKYWKAVLAPVMIVAGLVGFLCEFPVVDNERYTIWDTHYGNRFVYTYGGNDVQLGEAENIYEQDAESGLLRILRGSASVNAAYYAFLPEKSIAPGIEWLAVPKLPQGCTIDQVQWLAAGCTYEFSGDISGRFQICTALGYRRLAETWKASDVAFDNVGTYMVLPRENDMWILGVSNGFPFSAVIQIPEESEFTDEQIQELGVRLSAPRSWEVTLLVLVNILRGVCLATAVAGIVLLVLPALKRKKAGAVTGV